MSIVNEHKELRIKQLLSQEWETGEGRIRFNLYALGEDGKLYRKLPGKGTGWIEMNMKIDLIDDGIGEGNDEG